MRASSRTQWKPRPSKRAAASSMASGPITSSPFVDFQTTVPNSLTRSVGNQRYRGLRPRASPVRSGSRRRLRQRRLRTGEAAGAGTPRRRAQVPGGHAGRAPAALWVSRPARPADQGPQLPAGLVRGCYRSPSRRGREPRRPDHHGGCPAVRRGPGPGRRARATPHRTPAAGRHADREGRPLTPGSRPPSSHAPGSAARTRRRSAPVQRR
jgi:hypothetical protein